MLIIDRSTGSALLASVLQTPGCCGILFSISSKEKDGSQAKAQREKFVSRSRRRPDRGFPIGTRSFGIGQFATKQSQTDPLAALSPENRALFDTLRSSASHNENATTLAAGKKLLPTLDPGTPLSDFVALMTAGSAIQMGDTSYALRLLKPLAATHPDDWHVASDLARVYAETGDNTERDEQIAHVLALHQKSSDPDFAKLHIFPIQKVALHTGYALFLYPFEPLGNYNTRLIAIIFTNSSKEDYRIELESDDADQAFFKPKHPGDRRFSIDSYHESNVEGKSSESQALHGFIDGVFDYDVMRDRIVAVANGEHSPTK